MKRIITFVALLATVGMAAAKPVTVETARRAAENVLGRAVVDITPKCLAECYLFQGADGRGFVLLSADDIARPLLGFSETSTFRTDAIPAHVMSWLDGYQREIAYGREHGATAASAVRAEWEELLSGRTPEPKATAVDTLLHSSWDQSPLYNDMCPYDSVEGAHALVGCVATAVSQVMRYHGHPAQGRGSHAYKSKHFDTLRVDYSQSVYDWAHMPDVLTATSTEEEINAVAKLCYDVGVMMDMNYSTTGSGAYEQSGGMLQRFSAESGLENHLFYNPGMYAAFREGYTDEEWNAIIGGELEAHRPVVYTGSSSTAGHAFVIDGRNSRGHFHVNWGWGGYYNGYFIFGRLIIGYGTPNVASFNEMNNALVGVYPITPNTDVSTVEVVSADTSRGTVAGSGTYSVDSPRVFLRAHAKDGYRFDHWASGNRANPIFYYPTIDYHDTAYFVPLPPDTLGYGMDFAPNWDTVYTLSHTEWGIRIPAHRLPAGKELRKVQNFIYTTGQYVLRIYLGDMPSDTPVYEDTLQLESYGWRTIGLRTPIALDGTKDLWLTFAVDSVKYPAGTSPNTGVADGSWIKNPEGGWQLLDTTVIGFYTWVIRGIAYVPGVGIEEVVEEDFPATVSVRERSVTVETPEAQPLALYDLQGRQLAAVQGRRLAVRVPAAGIYVVRVADRSQKIIVF